MPDANNDMLGNSGAGSFMGQNDIHSTLEPLYKERDIRRSVENLLSNVNELFDVSSSSLSLNIQCPNRVIDLTYHRGVSKEFVTFYRDKRDHTDPIAIRSAAYAVDEGFTMASLCNQYPRWGNHKRSAFFSFGYNDALLVNFHSRKKDRGVLVLRSDARRGEFRSADTSRISLISPHLRTALQTHLQFPDDDASEHGLLNALSDSASAIFHVSKVGRLIKANAAAYEILNKTDGMSVEDNRLCAHDRESHFKLMESLRNIACHSRSTRILTIQRERGLFFLVRMVALDAYASDSSGIALIVADPFRSIRSEELLCSLFNLTLREAKVATKLGNGYELGEIALHNGVSINTAKSQRTSIYGKIGIKNQMQLVRIVNSLGALMEAETLDFDNEFRSSLQRFLSSSRSHS